MGLDKAAHNLQRAAEVKLSDPEVLQLVDPHATTLKTGRGGIPVNSDEEALATYLSVVAFPLSVS